MSNTFKLQRTISPSPIQKAAVGTDWLGFKHYLLTLIDHRRDLRCKRIIVTHMSQDMLDRLNSLELEYAEDGKVIIL